MKISPEKKRFQNINLLTILTLFVLILAGGVVRSTGSGMGCPDWPKCFDQFVPPTDASQIPAGYNDKSILVPEEFNAAKTWTEYINRLIGVISGFMLIATAFFSFTYFKLKKRIALLSILNVFLVGFQGWLGALVVSTNLVPWIVTIHMLLALAILALAIYTYHAAHVAEGGENIKAKAIAIAMAGTALLLSILQITFGTEVREKVDAIAGRLQGQGRSTWLNSAGSIFYNHRDMAIAVLAANLVLYALIRRGFSRHSVQQQVMSFSFLIVMLQIVSGIILSYMSLPPYAQAIHIVLASLLFGAQFYLLLNLQRSAKVWGASA
jgi:cytochrome c oxidase assembly protein subunit 15